MQRGGVQLQKANCWQTGLPAPRSHRRLANLITTAEKLCCILEVGRERRENLASQIADLRERSMPTHRQNLFTDACNLFLWLKS
jgi:hypothetical protein